MKISITTDNYHTVLMRQSTALRFITAPKQNIRVIYGECILHFGLSVRCFRTLEYFRKQGQLIGLF